MGSDPVAAPSRGPWTIAVSNSYLAAAVGELIEGEIEWLILAEPGMCPGHFDLRPSQVRQLLGSHLFVRFDFQTALDAYLPRHAEENPIRITVHIPGAMCEPASYLATCRQVGDSLMAIQQLSDTEREQRLIALEKRMDDLEVWTQDQIQQASLQDVPVLSSSHQASFCRFLGLNVEASYPPPDQASPSQIDQAVQRGAETGIRYVIANRPEGRQLADALASRLDAVVVVFDNFPAGRDRHAFDSLVRQNVRSLIDAAQP